MDMVVTRRQVRELVDQAKRTGVVPFVAERDLPFFRRECHRLGIRIEAEPITRTEGDCLRVAVSIAYAIEYDSTPDLDPLEVGPREQQAVWDVWAADRGWAWWRSDQQAPVGVSSWIALVPSKVVPGATHAIAMTRDKPKQPFEGGDPEWRDVGREDLVGAMMVIPLGHPLWDAAIEYWPITQPAGLAA